MIDYACDDDDDEGSDLAIETDGGFLQALNVVTKDDGERGLELYIDNDGPIDTVVPIGREQALEFYAMLGEALAELGWSEGGDF